jgi:hypothetical protein
MLKIDQIQYSGYEILYPDLDTDMATAVYVFTTFMYFQTSLDLLRLATVPVGGKQFSSKFTIFTF